MLIHKHCSTFKNIEKEHFKYNISLIKFFSDLFFCYLLNLTSTHLQSEEKMNINLSKKGIFNFRYFSLNLNLYVYPQLKTIGYV